MPKVIEPVSAPQAARLRRAVLNFRSSQHRRVFPTTVHVGDMDGQHASFVDSGRTDDSNRTRPARGGGGLDQAQRADIIGVLLDRTPPLQATDPADLWITRAGDVGTVHDIDAAWLAAAHQAFGEAGLPLTMIVITRSGWFDPRSGVLRRWRRLR